jgi:hypothetical protein
MTKVLFIFLCCLINSKLIAQADSLNFSESKIIGHWKLVDTKIVDEVGFLKLLPREMFNEIRVSEDSPWDSYQRNDLVFEVDSMFQVQYPLSSNGSLAYFIDSSYLHVSTKENSSKYPLQLLNDTLILYREMPNDPGYFKERFVRTSFNDSVLQVMKTYGINYPELAGTWKLVREEDYDYGTYYELIFPYTLPDSIILSRKQMLAALHGERTIQLSTNRKLRPYTFWYANSCLYLKPGEWYDGDDPMIHFWREN